MHHPSIILSLTATRDRQKTSISEKQFLSGINKEDVNIGVYEGKATVADIPIASRILWKTGRGNLRRSLSMIRKRPKEYLAQSAYNGEEFKILTVSGTKDESAAQIIQGQLIELGINCSCQCSRFSFLLCNF